ncbi:SDR family NAD(P)-dependent oxidoreductase [Pseudonocardia lutea]|uniref:SDR family NAD(P)-dependent oxidoreductase n=1 Tax=Pseudonocardia lutea TaxID=2172015 RepID=A0ABW1IDN1_9PSEU
MTLSPAALSGRTAVVTGGGAGIGARTAELLGAAGAHVLVVDRDAAAAAAVAKGLASAEPVALDLGDDAAIEAAADRFAAADILVNNAGVSRVERFVDSDPAGWDLLWRVNLRAPMRLAQAVLPGMTERGWGRVVFVATDSARAGAGGEGVYSATKAGLLGFAKTLARESARAGVTSNVVCPGLVDTAMLRGVAETKPGVIDALTKAIPMRRLGDVDEIAQSISFLCSPEASYVTGQTLSVNGGITMN